MGLLFHNAQESPSSAWSEAAFAGALGLKLGGPAICDRDLVDHPWLGTGTPDAGPAISAGPLFGSTWAAVGTLSLVVLAGLGIWCRG